MPCVVFLTLGLSDSNTLIVKTTVKGRGEAPERSSPVPPGPIVQQTTGKEAPVRTYQDLLKSPHDEDLFEYYAYFLNWSA